MFSDGSFAGTAGAAAVDRNGLLDRGNPHHGVDALRGAAGC